MVRITPSPHDKAEWSRLATAAYHIGANSVGHRYSVAASLHHGAQIPLDYYDDLQAGYRAWLLMDALAA